MFNAVNDYVVNKCKLEFQNCVGVCSDGAAALTGRHSGVVAQIKSVCQHANQHIALFTENP